MSEDLPEQEPHKLDEVMLAMDVVDTLRHEQTMLAHDLSAPDREAQLIARLREIYDAQGIEVPDEILREGVRAMDDHRFAYEPYKGGFISRAYISRGKWGKPLLVVLGMVGMAWSINYAAFDMPKNAQAKKTERLLERDLPKAMQAAYEDGQAAARTADAKDKIEALYGDGMAAIKAGDAREAQRLETELTQTAADLGQSYKVRIVSRPGEKSGLFRVNDDNVGARNYYLIVEAISASGKALPVNIISEEDQKIERVKTWGVRVPNSVYLAVAADKRDDQIIQSAVIGEKKRGALVPTYTVDTLGGLILEW